MINQAAEPKKPRKYDMNDQLLAEGLQETARKAAEFDRKHSLHHKSPLNDSNISDKGNTPNNGRNEQDNAVILFDKLQNINYGVINGDYFIFTMDILKQYRYNLINYSLEYEYTYKDQDKKEVTNWVKLSELIIIHGYVVDNEDRRFFNLDLFNRMGDCKNFIVPVDLDTKFLSALYAKGVTKHYNRNFNVKVEEFILRVIRINDRVIKGVRPFNCGWLDKSTYFFPNENQPVFIGANAKDYYYIQSKDKRYISGTVDDWKNNVAVYTIGNPMLEFGVYTAFTGFLMPELGISLSYGFHIYSYLPGTFKSLMLLTAGSVMGNKEAIQKQWKQTGNNLDLLCALANHGLLVLDEMKQLNRQIALSDIIMQIGNNQGRGRMSQDGISSRELLRWQLCYLSSGNRPTEQYILEREGGDLMGAEETRLYNLEMIPPTNYHKAGTKQQLAKDLHNGINKYHGAAGYEFMSRYLANHNENKQWLLNKYQVIQNEYNQRVKEHAKEIGSVDIHDRIIPAFASVAVAGALALRLGILPEGCNPINTVWQVLMQYLVDRGGNIDEQAWLAKLHKTVVQDRNKYFFHGDNKPRDIYGHIANEMQEEIAYVIKNSFALIFDADNFRKVKVQRNFFVNIGVMEELRKDGKDYVIKQYGLHERAVRVIIEKLSELVNP